MITGTQLRTAREKRGWTQEQLAAAIGVTHRSVGNWERGDVPANKEARLREVLGDDLTPGGNPLTQASDLALISELARRLASRGREEQSDAGATPKKSTSGAAEAEPQQDGPRSVGSVIRRLPSQKPRYTSGLVDESAADDVTSDTSHEQGGKLD